MAVSERFFGEWFRRWRIRPDTRMAVGDVVSPVVVVDDVSALNVPPIVDVFGVGINNAALPAIGDHAVVALQAFARAVIVERLAVQQTGLDFALAVHGDWPSVAKVSSTSAAPQRLGGASPATVLQTGGAASIVSYDEISSAVLVAAFGPTSTWMQIGSSSIGAFLDLGLVLMPGQTFLMWDTAANAQLTLDALIWSEIPDTLGTLTSSQP